jgi:hypothetical protein
MGGNSRFVYNPFGIESDTLVSGPMTLVSGAINLTQ